MVLPELQSIVAKLDHLAQRRRYLEAGSSMFERLPLEVLQLIVAELFASGYVGASPQLVSHGMSMAIRSRRWRVRHQHPELRRD